MKETILDYEVFGGGVAQCVRQISAEIHSGRRWTWLACLNPHSYAVALHDADFRAALHSADWLVPDGVGVLLASRVFGGNLHERITGSDVFIGVNGALNLMGNKRIFLLGSTKETLGIVRDRIQRDFPNLEVAGTYSPAFRAVFSEEECDQMCGAINAAQADVLWVSMTAPKQEKWLAQNLPKIDVQFAGAVGAVFDFYAGNVQRSPLVFRRLGLEWLPRLIREPRRLWRRMFVSAPVFVARVLAEKARRYRVASRQ